MKKFYSLALLASVAVTATAAAPQLKTLAPVKAQVQNTLSEETLPMATFTKINLLADDDQSIEGTYELTLDDVYFQDGAGRLVQTAAIQKNADGTITISSDYFVSDVTADYDEATNAITFSKIKLGEITLQSGAKYYLQFEPGVWDNAAGDVVAQSYSVTYNPADGTIVFPADHNFGWMAYSNALYTQSAGYFDLFDVISFEKSQAVEIDEVEDGKWTNVGYATLVDGWFLPTFSIDGVGVNPADYPWEVQLQRSVENANVFRLWEPYTNFDCPIAGNNSSKYHGQIVFDITDPSHVIVKAGYYAGFATTSQGEFCAFDLLGYQINGFGNEFDEALLPQIYAFMEQYGQPFTTMEGDVITVNKVVFCNSLACDKAYSWNNVNYVTSTITLPEGAGMTDVNVDANAPVVYYNLQGMKVNNPAAGNVYIRCQDGVATKIYKR